MRKTESERLDEIEIKLYRLQARYRALRDELAKLEIERYKLEPTIRALEKEKIDLCQGQLMFKKT